MKIEIDGQPVEKWSEEMIDGHRVLLVHPPTPTRSAERDGDLAGRLEQVRAWAEKQLPMPYDREILNIVDGKVIGGVPVGSDRPPDVDAPCICGPKACKKECSVCSRGDCLKKKTPADRLADTAEGMLLRTGPYDSGPTWEDLRGALDEYRSTRNSIGQTTDQAFGTPPDPILVARHLLDCLTGGALSSLICAVRDEVIPRWGVVDLGMTDRHALDNIITNLRALGEKIEE